MTNTPNGTPKGTPQGTPRAAPDGAAGAMADLDKAASVIATARRVLADGGMVDLSALEGRIEALCEALRGVAPSERDAAVRAVERLLADLDELEKAIRARFGDALAAADDAEAAARRRAADAYGTNKLANGNGGQDKD